MPRDGLRVWPGRPHPCGATWDGRGVNFALFSDHAERVELCLFDARGRRELARVPLPEYTDRVWHGYFPDLRPGQLYGYRVHGPYAPERGHRFNPNKLLLDPYAKALRGGLLWSDAHFGYRVGHRNADLSFDRRNSAPGMPKCVVVDTAFTWAVDEPPRRPWSETVIYELHVRGHTMRHPEVPEAQRGTFAGLAAPAVIRHLRELGVTAVELLPIHAFVDDRQLLERGLRNYWGYNTLGFFAPDPRYLSEPGALAELKTLVQHLHDADIEVFLDVVYNHTAEGNHLGPTLSFRGIDNAAYYRLVPDQPRYYQDFTGCGNALNLHHPRVLQMVMDSLRYWVEEMHVDGFRFDLATTLARGADGGYDEHAGFLDAIGQDPTLSRVKRIAEPWDVGDFGYQLGRFPPGWSEWNDRYRDTVRRFWVGEFGMIGELASRVTGSADLFDHGGRRPWASVHFVTAHDGFTLRDLVGYDHKHNEANGEDDRDGSDANHSWNCGVEGPSDDPQVRALRLRQSKNLLATLLLSQGVPMLLAGDELGRSQGGNNNAYCQDGPLSWTDWEGVDEDGRALLAFVRRLIALRRHHLVFRRRRFFSGQPERAEIQWLRPDGAEMKREDWESGFARTLALWLRGAPHERHRTAHGEPEVDDDVVVIANAHDAPVEHRLPGDPAHGVWELVLDTSDPEAQPAPLVRRAGEAHPVGPRSLCAFVRRAAGRAAPRADPDAPPPPAASRPLAGSE